MTRLRILPLALLLLLGLLSTACGARAFEAAVGECVDLPADGEQSGFETVECEGVHDSEVFALVQHPGDDDAPFPGSEAIAEFAGTNCIEEFEPYVGSAYETSALYFFPLIPVEATWENGDREIICLLRGEPDAGGSYAQLDGSKRNSEE